MELVDTLGLKPSPSVGPGSIPGTGIPLLWLFNIVAPAPELIDVIIYTPRSRLHSPLVVESDYVLQAFTCLQFPTSQFAHLAFFYLAAFVVGNWLLHWYLVKVVNGLHI